METLHCKRNRTLLDAEVKTLKRASDSNRGVTRENGGALTLWRALQCCVKVCSHANMRFLIPVGLAMVQNTHSVLYISKLQNLPTYYGNQVFHSVFS